MARDPSRRPQEISTPAGTVFETIHRACSALHYHRHGYAYATIVLAGAYTEVRDRLPERLGPASVVVHDPHEEHADYFASDAHCLNVELPTQGPIGTSLPAARLQPSIRAAVDGVVRAFYAPAGTLQDELEHAVAHFQATLRSQPDPSTGRRPPWLGDVLRRFAWHEATPLGAAARIAGVHQTHFSRAFRRHVGMTPQAFRVRTRVRLASDLLLASPAPVAQIGLHCGFADQAHFTRTFGRTVGVTPAEYRRIFRR